ncbi:alpha/beta hydrolase [Reichenbachiella agarivorans]|uniref:Alpha/beta hydrolase n=1 Tax=Reichenbachiella agarivorans TaxID=2979464 RepID=A0ABY6CRT1_9BACT|nr:alpha/beta hydrolase [Reichenbachiella agarivorans]UXP32549.1 alpha/beta hydrolase [Reichenbachiella agarivorans]
MRIYTISGLGADERVFSNLDTGHELIHLPWLPPLSDESLAAYAKRLSQKIDTSQAFSLLGVSFGGIVAVEMEKILNPERVILISSAQIKSDLNPIFRFIGKTGILKNLPLSVFRPQPKYVARLFDVQDKYKELLFEILKDSDDHFTKWAMHSISTWQNEHQSHRVMMIHGTKDKVLNCPKRAEVIKIHGAGHGMIMNRSNEINELIRKIYHNDTKE